jgi:hypothetical protein
MVDEYVHASACMMNVDVCKRLCRPVGPWMNGGTVGGQGPRKNSGSHIDASHSRQPLVKGERLVRYEVNAVMQAAGRH